MKSPPPTEAATTDVEPWEFAGWGVASRISNLPPCAVDDQDEDKAPKKLGVWASTAICGNDISSSCLYVSALSAAHAGAYAPIALALVAAVLFLFRRIYAEVGTALPLNGGTYTVLLNTTNKKLAAGAACLTLLSYVATAVISAGEAMHYAHNLVPALDVFWATVGLLATFAVLNLIGIGESAVVAIVIFVFHIVTLTVLVVFGGIVAARDPSLLMSNWAEPSSEGLLHALYFGFAAAMLGISGFESSANFIEEQEPGVFPKTLRNMWVVVAIFNPLISLLSLALIPLAQIRDVPPDLLAQMGNTALGGWFRTWISIDAVLVLSGAVLTSYVGVTGLVRRMTLDRCLPRFLLKENAARGTNHYIIIGFFAVCCSILVMTTGDVEMLAGVYTLSFLAVMALFAVGNMLLKSKRARLPRAVRASWMSVIIAFCAVCAALVGNVLIDPDYVRVFGTYFAGASLVVGVMFLRVQLMRVLLNVSRWVVERVQRVNTGISTWVRGHIVAINELGVVYFTKGDDPAEFNRAALYVQENEQTSRMTVIHVYEREDEIPPKLAQHLTEIDHLYPNLRIDFIAVKGTFGPELIADVSKLLDVPTNYMFIGTPGDRFPHRIETLGGVRLIL